MVDTLELTSLLSGAHDSCNALVSIHARDGGTDANDWAEMLLARVARIEEEKREAGKQAQHQSKPKTGFGSQIRNYFLHPDQRVKGWDGYAVGGHAAGEDAIGDCCDSCDQPRSHHTSRRTRPNSWPGWERSFRLRARGVAATSVLEETAHFEPEVRKRKKARMSAPA